MAKKLDRTQCVIIAGVGGQGALTIAQLVLGAAWRSDYYCLQSEVHGMSQRGGEVNAQILFDSEPVTAPITMEGKADVLIGLEPLEALRYLPMMKEDATVVVSTVPIKNMSTYPETESLINELKKYPNIKLVDTAAHSKALNNRHAGNTTLLGLASKYLPIEDATWKEIFEERFGAKGEAVVAKNMEAFELGKSL